MEEEEGEVLSRGWRRCSGEGDRCTVPGHTAMPESAFREHWPPALRLRSLCGTEGGGGREGEGEGEGETVASERWVGVGKREEHRIVSGERSPLARPSIPAAAGCSAAGRSDVPNEYQQAQPPPPPAPLRPPPSSLSVAVVAHGVARSGKGSEFYFRGRGARADTNDCSDSVLPGRCTAAAGSCFSKARLWPIEVAREEDAAASFRAETPRARSSSLRPIRRPPPPIVQGDAVSIK